MRVGEHPAWSGLYHQVHGPQHRHLQGITASAVGTGCWEPRGAAPQHRLLWETTVPSLATVPSAATVPSLAKKQQNLIYFVTSEREIPAPFLTEALC